MLKKPDFSTITLAIQNQAIVNSHGRTIFQVFATCGTVYFINPLAEIFSLYQSRSAYLGIVSRLLLACFKRSMFPDFARPGLRFWVLYRRPITKLTFAIVSFIHPQPLAFSQKARIQDFHVRDQYRCCTLLCLNVLVILKRRLLPLIWFMYDLAKMRCRLLSIQWKDAIIGARHTLLQPSSSPISAAA